LEWKRQVIELRENIQAIVSKYPELYDYLTIDSSTGAWQLSEKGMDEYIKKVYDELLKAQSDLHFKTAIANYSDAVAGAMTKNQKNDNTL
jgi:hypothetical protein